MPELSYGAFRSQRRDFNLGIADRPLFEVVRFDRQDHQAPSCRLTHQQSLMYNEPMSTTDTNPTRVARWFHALSDETRLRIVEMLQRGEYCVCDLQDSVGAAQSRLSFHLKVLREAGLVNDRKEGRWNFYSLRPDVLDEMSTYLLERKPEEISWPSCACGAAGGGECCN